MQRKLHGRHNRTYEYKTNILANDTIHRYNSSSNHITIPLSSNIVRHYNQKKDEEVPESTTTTKDHNSRVIRIPSSIKYREVKDSNEPLSAVQRNPIRITVN